MTQETKRRRVQILVPFAREVAYGDVGESTARDDFICGVRLGRSDLRTTVFKHVRDRDVKLAEPGRLFGIPLIIWKPCLQLARGRDKKMPSFLVRKFEREACLTPHEYVFRVAVMLKFFDALSGWAAQRVWNMVSVILDVDELLALVMDTPDESDTLPAMNGRHGSPEDFRDNIIQLDQTAVCDRLVDLLSLPVCCLYPRRPYSEPSGTRKAVVNLYSYGNWENFGGGLDLPPAAEVESS